MVRQALPAEVERLWHLGFAIHWLRPKSKIPVESGWNTGERHSLEWLSETYRREYNYGVRLGRPSRISGGYLAVIDLDIKSDSPRHRDEALAKLSSLYPESRNAPYLLSGRGNGSAHYYVRLLEPVSCNGRAAKSKDLIKVLMPSARPSEREINQLSKEELSESYRLRPAWEISLLCEGRQAVLVGSDHPDTGLQYRWGKPVSKAQLPLLKLSDADKSLGSIPNAKEPAGSEFVLVDVDPKSLPLTRDQLSALVDGRGVVDRSAKVYELCIVLSAARVPRDTILSVFTQRELHLGQTAFEHARTSSRLRAARWVERYCLRKAKSRVEDTPFDVEELPATPSDKSKAAINPEKRVWPEGFSGEDWEKELELKFIGGGKPPIIKTTLANIHLILARRCKRPDFLKLEDFSRRSVWQCDTPWGARKGDERSSGIEDAVVIKQWFASQYKVEPPNVMIDEALLLTALFYRYHAVKDYLEGLEWDGVERLSGAFKTYLGAIMPEPYLSEVSRKFFLACVKRIFNPGCKFDYTVVLEGKQGRGKSTFASTIASNDWFLDGLPNLQDKDAALNLQGSWICELGELAAVYKSATEATKAFISRTTDKVRPPYGHRRVDLPRSTVFIGTTNRHVYLFDPTGNRRYWPVAIRQCDFAALERDRDQLWAEATWRHYFAPEKLYLENAALHQAGAVQELRRVEDEGDSMIILFKSWLEGEKKEGRSVKEIKLMELFQALPWGVLSASRANAMRGGEILKQFGYRKKRGNSGSKWVRK